MAVNINVPSQVKTYANLAAFPASGALKTIYIAEDTNKTYRWTGSVYVEISASAAMTWGQIGGTLSNQTDLQNALDAKVPTSRTLTINGVTQDLSADRTFTIATGLTVGTTPIASGTIGRVLFQGTGNVLQQSSSLFWDSTNNRLGIGTDTPLYRFDVTGMSRFNTNIATTNSILRLTDNTNGTAWMGYSSVVAVGFFMGANGAVTLGTGIGGDNSAPTGSQISIRPVTGARMGFNTNSANDGFQFSDGANGTIRFNFPSSNETAITTLSTHNFSIGTASGTTGITTTTMKFFQSTGNVGIGTTTDAGFRLDVNGTARVQGNATFSTNLSIGTTLTPNKLTLYGDAMNIRRNGANLNVGLLISDDTKNWQFIANRATNSLNIYDDSLGANRFIVSSTGNILINTTTDAGFRLDVNGTARVQDNFQVGTGTTFVSGFVFRPSTTQTMEIWNGVAVQIRLFREGNNSLSFASSGNVYAANLSSAGLLVGGANVNSKNDSAMLQADSTTRGFLPPRMTTTQKNAIASPATGLQVYDTTLNQMSYYNGTTWTNI